MVLFSESREATVLSKRSDDQLSISVLYVQHLGGLIARELEVEDHDLKLESLLQAYAAQVVTGFFLG